MTVHFLFEQVERPSSFEQNINGQIKRAFKFLKTSSENHRNKANLSKSDDH